MNRERQQNHSMIQKYPGILFKTIKSGRESSGKGFPPAAIHFRFVRPFAQKPTKYVRHFQ